jgi:serine/threonine-protein kinase RsbW/stage II sporulation protein AB (anti-sigma F factor)
MPTMRQQWSGPAEPATVARLRRAVTDFAAWGGASASSVESLRSCTSEAVTNSVVHAFRDGREPGTISMSAEFRADELFVTVSDDGMGFSPRSDSPGLGLGIPTIGALSGSMSIGMSDSGGTELCMAFALKA